MAILRFIALLFPLLSFFAISAMEEKQYPEFIYELTDAQYGPIPQEPQLSQHFDVLQEALHRDAYLTPHECLSQVLSTETIIPSESQSENLDIENDLSYKELKKRKQEIQSVSKAKKISFHTIEVCALCEKVCKSSAQLQKHYKNIHKIEKTSDFPMSVATKKRSPSYSFDNTDYICNKCGKVCKDAQSLKSHKMIHGLHAINYTIYEGKILRSKFDSKVSQNKISIRDNDDINTADQLLEDPEITLKNDAHNLRPRKNKNF